MTGKRKLNGRTSSVPGGLAAGSFVSIAVTALSAALLAMLLDREILAWENVGYGIAFTILLAAYAGAITAWNRIRRQRLIVCLMSGMVYWGILLSLTALFFGGQFEAVGVTLLLIAGGCLCACLPAGKGSGGSRHAVRKLKTR